MGQSYAYATGSVRARETALLQASDLDQLAAASSERELLTLLKGKGYGESGDAQTIDALLKHEEERLWAYVDDIAPDPHLLDAFRIRHDVHNAKVVVKAVLANRMYEKLLLYPTTIDPKELETSVKEHRFSALPRWLAESFEKAYELLAQTGDAQLADAVLDRAAMEEMLAAARRTGDPLLGQLIEQTILFQNMKIALRSVRVGKGSRFLETALCPCPGMDPETWILAVREGEEVLLKQLERISQDAVEAFRQSPSTFEKWVDNTLMEQTRQAKRITIGASVLVGYFMAKEREIQAVHLIACGIRIGLDREQIRERGRILYG